MKGSLNAFDFADIVERSFLNCSNKFKTRKVPVADGGDFTGEILKQALHAKEIKCIVIGPFGQITESRFAVSKNIAIIEMADASGMKLIDRQELNPLQASSYGTGQLILEAINQGCNQIYLGVGGSATVDGGSGMLEALKFKLIDDFGNELKGCGENLIKVKHILSPQNIQDVEFKIISDVNNPLLGKNGAAEIFGPQKGATPQMVKILEKGLNNWGSVLEKQCNKEFKKLKGAGAAGGIALPLIAFFKSELMPGAEFILQQLDFEKHLSWADIVITGEGKIDGQTLNTKAPMAVANYARKYKKPVFAIAGSVDYEATKLFDGIFSIINEPMELEDALKKSKFLLEQTSNQLAKLIFTLKK
jgi:glycerate kinase